MFGASYLFASKRTAILNFEFEGFYVITGTLKLKISSLFQIQYLPFPVHGDMPVYWEWKA